MRDHEINLPDVNPITRKLLQRDYDSWHKRKKLQVERVCRICGGPGFPAEMREIKYNNRGEIKKRYQHWTCKK